MTGVIATLRDEENKQAMSEKLLEIDFVNGAALRVGNQFGVGRIAASVPKRKE